MQRWVHVFRDIFDEDNYHPMQVSLFNFPNSINYQVISIKHLTIQVTTAAEYQKVMDSFPYRDANLEAAPFPKRFPFSSMVPRVYRQIQNYIQACLQFSQDLNLSDQVIDDTLRRYTNLLLTRTLSGCLSTLIRKPSLSLLQLIQISINTNYLEESNGWLEEFIAQLTGASRELSHIARLQGRAVFRDVRDDAEQQIYEALKRKMDEFMELTNYDWLLNEPSGQASSYLMDLIAFLQSTFQAFTNLKVRPFPFVPNILVCVSVQVSETHDKSESRTAFECKLFHREIVWPNRVLNPFDCVAKGELGFLLRDWAGMTMTDSLIVDWVFCSFLFGNFSDCETVFRVI